MSQLRSFSSASIKLLNYLFNPEIVARDYYQKKHKLKIIIGCVDNAIARQSIAQALSQYQTWHTRDVYKFHELGCIKLVVLQKKPQKLIK